MNDRSENPASARDWLDIALASHGADHRAAHVADEGFTARVMSALPAPAALPAWRKPVVTALWAAAGIGAAFALPGAVTSAAVDVLRDVIRLAVQPVSLGQIVGGVATLALATWATAYAVLRQD